MRDQPTDELAARIAAKKAEPAFQTFAKAMEAPVNIEAVWPVFLREAAAICDEAGGKYAGRDLNDQAGAAFALMETFLRKANEAEYVATPCDPMVACEDGGEPCHVHERLMAHAEGDHELCEPDCGPAVPVSSPPPDQTALRDLVEAAIKASPFHELRTVDHAQNGPLQITVRVDELADVLVRRLTAAPPPTTRAAVYREVADRLTTDAHGMQPDWARIYKRDAAVKVREWAEQLDGEGRQDGGETRVPCSWVAVRSSHSPHDWEPQPGMEPVHCPGYCLPPMDPVHILGIDATSEPPAHIGDAADDCP